MSSTSKQVFRAAVFLTTRLGRRFGAGLPAGRCARRRSTSPSKLPDHPDGQFAPNAFIRIDNTGKTTLVMPQAEMGQGVYTAIAMILAEELDADFAQVAIEHAPPSDKLYGNPLFGIQVDRQFQLDPRVLGQAARGRAAAARHADRGGGRAMAGRSAQAAARQTARSPMPRAAARSSYGELADAAGKLPVPDKPKLKDPKDFTLIGKPLKRFDTPNKTDGKTIYGIDAMVPDMKFATLAPVPGARRQGQACRRQRREESARCAAGRRARRSRRRRRRSYVGGLAGPRCARNHLGRRAERQDQFGRYLE